MIGSERDLDARRTGYRAALACLGPEGITKEGQEAISLLVMEALNDCWPGEGDVLLAGQGEVFRENLNEVTYGLMIGMGRVIKGLGDALRLAVPGFDPTGVAQHYITEAAKGPDQPDA